MSSYRPSYGNPYDYPPPPGAMPPLPRGPPPSYDQYRGGDSYRPPQVEFSFRSNDQPRFPPEYTQENGQSRPRNNHHDNKNLNQARRGRTYKPRVPYRAAPADRPLLRHHDQADSTEQMLGMVNGQKFIAAEDISDSEEENMDESESDADQNGPNNLDLVSMPMGAEGDQAAEEFVEPAPKRRALTSISQNVGDGASEPKWSNPDPYTVLPPVDEQRKRKDVVKLIRKSRKDAEGNVTELNQVAANDDFISFGMEDDEVATPSSPSVDGQNGFGSGGPEATSAPRSFSHLQNLHGQEPLEPPDQPVSAHSGGFLPISAHDRISVPEEIVLDTPQNQSNFHTRFAPDGDEALGNRKRTRDDSIKGRKNGASHINGSILHGWIPLPGTDPTPWLRRTRTLTANAGFRLHKEICDFYDFVKPQHFEQTVRQELLSRLQSMVANEIPHASVMCFGSFAAGMYLPNADMDVVVVSSSFRTTGHKVVCQTGSQLSRFADFVRSSKLGTSVEKIANARVPLVKFVDTLTGIRVDVSFENDTGILANDTFASWKRQYPAMPVLVTVIKQFLMMRGLNEVVHGGLGGFSVTCLVTSLLQNMPRVQTGELVPEENLGELLIEFLDFYGNRLDTTRTGIMMRPPGYFEKQTYRRPNQPRRAIYQANKADRLAIMDPNRVDNDISGGSRLVMLIFERFSHAHREILRAMKTPGRISLLDWSLGGNYDSFTLQRNRLRELYGERQGPLGEIPDQYQAPKISTRGGSGPLDQPHAYMANAQNTEVVPQAKAKPKALNGKKPETRVERKAAVLQQQKERAVKLKAQFPDMEGIPDSLSHGKRAKLIAEHARKGAITAEAAQLAQSTQPRARAYAALTAAAAQPMQSANLARNQARACALKQKYPDMANIPNAINKKQQRKFVEAYLSQNNGALPQTAHRQADPQVAVSGRKSARLAQMPQRPPYPTEQRQPIHHPTRQHSHLQGNTGRPISNKMAPLSDERRAEVARNLEGTSTEDPINLD